MNALNIIYKYPLQQGYTTLDLPVGAQILDVIVQNHQIQLYAIVDPNITDTESHDFMVAGTGQPFPVHVTPTEHIATVQDGPFVWHAFHLARE